MAPVSIAEDYYAVLEVTKNDTFGVIKKSYKRLALERHPDRDKSLTATAAFNWYSHLTNIPFRRDTDFVDRKELDDQIHAILSTGGTRAALVGLGGVGKSQIAIEYCYRVREQS
ncbi:hypothetical protein LTR22_025793 [Elasticomyces elasticus]|nr:hypothetical protein LTR22_025793 [Elasticomyces elasticus]